MFPNRTDAGQKLAEALEPLRDDQPIVLALPRGCVPVAFEVARALGAPLDVLVVRKLGAPDQPELGVGAISEGGNIALDPELCDYLGLGAQAIEALARREARELERRVRRFRGGRPLPDLHGRTIILVDDGIATGGTVRAAIGALRRLGVGRLVLAVPVACVEAGGLRALVDDYVCLEEHEYFGAVGRFYQDFTQVSDDEVVDLLERARSEPVRRDGGAIVMVPADGVVLTGALEIPANVRGVVAFAHGSGSSRHSPRNQHVAAALREAGFATLLIDLLSSEEDRIDRQDASFRFDIDLLASRVVAIVDWLGQEKTTAHMPLGLFGASTGAAAALGAAAERPARVAAVVSRGGRPDLAQKWLPKVVAPTLLIVGGADDEVIALNRVALSGMRTEAELKIVPDATHLFEEPGALEAVEQLAIEWFTRHLVSAGRHLAA